MWSARTELLSNGRVLKTFIDRGATSMTFAEVLCGWRDDIGFRSFFTELLANCPFSDFRWETPSITTESVSRHFEFVLLDSPGLASVPEPDAFADYFIQPTTNAGIVSFQNLGKDAVLVVPCPLGPSSAYRHLAAFLREAPEPQKHSLWRAVAEVTTQALGPNPIWLSTAGAGVSWLHVRIDEKPKYYGYGPYRAASHSKL
jgi:hypothetical protein